ncbi:bifunctional 3'-5' exonuclease/DNA polymerase [Microbacterium awajiense]|uniref:DNA-directed DNA polymerase n=1 Tax=Microbacterium awajiense TaxID=415214 RepID=A0ABP7A5P0_9MICO
MPAIEPVCILLGRVGAAVAVDRRDGAGELISHEEMPLADLAAWVARHEGPSVRWVWNDTPQWYPALLASGVRVARCHDLRLCRAILRSSALVADSAPFDADGRWDAASEARVDPDDGLFDLAEFAERGLPSSPDDTANEWMRQRAALRDPDTGGRLRILTAAESAGALVAAELRSAGVPWDAAEHDRILTDTLGARTHGVPQRMQELATQVRVALDDAAVSLDSQPKLLRALHRAGIPAQSTARWELAEYAHPAIAPLIEYKKLARLYSANGWSWLEEWVRDARFRPTYVPGGVVTGRWASSGGGALQLPRPLRAAVRADPGWRLVVADVAQLEPRVLAAMSRDGALAGAARGADLYDGIVAAGAVSTRAEAKIAVLGAMYGATTGESGRLLPGLRRTYPAAMALVDAAAKAGEDGEVVSTWLGRTSPLPSAQWRHAQSAATEDGATSADVSRARQWARERGRFTRNFIVQGTAAEWALVWLAELRRRLAELAPTDGARAEASGVAFAQRAHLAFFLHDEVIVHTPAERAQEVADAVQDASDAAGAALFGDFPIDFPLDVRIGQTARED